MWSKSNRRPGGSYLGAALALAVLCGFGCRPEPAVPATAVAVPTAATEPATTAPQRERPERPTFDGGRAFAHLKKQCDFGPRYLGTEGHEKLRAYLIAELKKTADSVHTQEFAYKGLPVTNVIGVFHAAGETAPSKTPVVLLAHWDTRPVADGPFSTAQNQGPAFRYESRRWNRLTPILGANDGASGVAVLLELARLFKEKRPPVGVLILFVDGEDYGDFRGNNGEGDGVLLGSRHFAANYRKTPAFGQPQYGILLDMVGAKNLLIPREDLSQQYAPGTNEKVFRAARSLGYGKTFRFDLNHSVEDDHVPLCRAGIPTIDLIHPLPFGEYEQTGYRYWHTPEDTPDKCSPESLKIVGEVVSEVIYQETP